MKVLEEHNLICKRLHKHCDSIRIGIQAEQTMMIVQHSI
jgi:hypothetical protein